jgi:hypothetical protein
MSFLDWMRRNQSVAENTEARKVAELPNVTKRGNPIAPLHAGAWYLDDSGRNQLRHHMGISKEGYHGGLEASLANGGRVFRWSNAREEGIKAEGASYAMGELWDREHSAVPKVVWIGDVYQGKGKEAWGWVQKTVAGKFNSGISVFASDVGLEEWRTAEGYVTKGSATQAAQKSFKEWRDAKAPEMELASPQIQKDVRSMYRIVPKANRERDKGHPHGWER